MFAGERLELLDGLLVVREPQGSSHAAIVEQIGRVLAARSATAGTSFRRHHAPLALGEHSEPEPDVAVVAGMPRDYVAAHPSTVALVVEVADSSLRLDRRVKANVYARAGVPEYWIVNLVARTLEVYRDPQPAADARTTGPTVTDVLSLPADVAPLRAPGVRIPLADLLP